MPVISKALFRGAATTTTSTTLYTVPASTTAVSTNIVITNTSASSRTFTMSLADVPFATTTLVGANDSLVLDIKQTLSAGQTIKGGASATDVHFHISGVEIS